VDSFVGEPMVEESFAGWRKEADRRPWMTNNLDADLLSGGTSHSRFNSFDGGRLRDARRNNGKDYA
jgi:hypothetical protein